MTTDKPVCEYHYALTRRGAVAAVAEIRALAEAQKAELGDFHCQECAIYPDFVDAVLAILERHRCG